MDVVATMLTQVVMEAEAIAQVQVQEATRVTEEARRLATVGRPTPTMHLQPAGMAVNNTGKGPQSTPIR
jgi:hypothetical protein